ncbi:hypothetical protein AWC38_SpisGene5141 [Stylophora pistillata]|uniref:Uncharacterized protein n=1 Tax=Stylophora pistillata TaxID=50429 RepID=A0A2B4SHA9_STYPI|nr:hypothetical protein AWC38_SpisGene5141 [Stylophora pistillata]
MANSSKDLDVFGDPTEEKEGKEPESPGDDDEDGDDGDDTIDDDDGDEDDDDDDGDDDRDKIQRQVMHTARRLMNEDGMDREEALEAAVDRRKFLINRLLESPILDVTDDDDDDDDDNDDVDDDDDNDVTQEEEEMNTLSN